DMLDSPSAIGLAVQSINRQKRRGRARRVWTEIPPAFQSYEALAVRTMPAVSSAGAFRAFLRGRHSLGRVWRAFEESSRETAHSWRCLDDKDFAAMIGPWHASCSRSSLPGRRRTEIDRGREAIMPIEL